MSDWSEGNWDFGLNTDWGGDQYFDDWNTGSDLSNTASLTDIPDFSSQQDFSMPIQSFQDQMFPNYNPMGVNEMFDTMWPSGTTQIPGVDLSGPQNILESLGYSNPMEGWGTPGTMMPSRPDYQGMANLGFGALRALMDYKGGRTARDAYTNVANQRLQAANQVKSPPFNKLRYDMLTTNAFQRTPIFQQLLRDSQKQLNTRLGGRGQVGSGAGALLNSGLVSQVLKDYMGMIPEENNAAFAQLLQGAGEPQLGAANAQNSQRANMLLNLQNIWRIMNTKNPTSGTSFNDAIFGDFAR